MVLVGYLSYRYIYIMIMWERIYGMLMVMLDGVNI